MAASATSASRRGASSKVRAALSAHRAFVKRRQRVPACRDRAFLPVRLRMRRRCGTPDDDAVVDARELLTPRGGRAVGESALAVLDALPPDRVRALELLADLRMDLACVREHVLDARLDRLVDEIADGGVRVQSQQ